MVSKKITITSPIGLNLQPAGRLSEMAVTFESEVTFLHEGSLTNAKSLLGVLGACVRFGDELELICEGPDEEEALAAVAGILEKDYSE